jgi:predicted amidohydrolase YtcJ
VYEPDHPLRGLHVAVTGRTLAGVLKDGEQVSRMEALRMWTINNAAALDQDLDRGSLRAGKLADLVVLSGNFEECSDDELADLVVDMTVIAGNVVFAR